MAFAKVSITVTVGHFEIHQVIYLFIFSGFCFNFRFLFNGSILFLLLIEFMKQKIEHVTEMLSIIVVFNFFSESFLDPVFYYLIPIKI